MRHIRNKNKVSAYVFSAARNAANAQLQSSATSATSEAPREEPAKDTTHNTPCQCLDPIKFITSRRLWLMGSWQQARSAEAGSKRTHGRCDRKGSFEPTA